MNILLINQLPLANYSIVAIIIGYIHIYEYIHIYLYIHIYKYIHIYSYIIENKLFFDYICRTMKITINDDITINDNIIIGKNIIIDKNSFYTAFIIKYNIYYHSKYNNITDICYKIVKSSNGYYNYIIQFIKTLSGNYSNILINKGTSKKYRYILLNMLNFYNIFFYTYFIHKKYIIKIYNTKYENLFDTSITSKKLFNCRDFCKIYSYI